MTAPPTALDEQATVADFVGLPPRGAGWASCAPMCSGGRR